MQILPNIILVNGYPYGQHQNSYLIQAPQATLLVDGGDLDTPDTLPLVLRNIARWGVNPAELDYFLVTHAHFDHSSHAAALKRLAPNLKIVANTPCAEALAAGDERCIGYAVNRTFEPCAVDVLVADGDVLDLGGLAVRCLAAPGHAESCIIYEMVVGEERAWFVGDVMMMAYDGQSAAPGWNGGPDYDQPTYLQTLRRLANLSCDHLLPGHGPAALWRGQQRVREVYTQGMMHWR